MLILGIFFKSSIGGWWRQLVDFCWWLRVLPVGGGGGLCLGMLVAGCAMYGGVLLKFSLSLSLSLSFVEVFGFGICWRIGDCGCSLWWWL